VINVSQNKLVAEFEQKELRAVIPYPFTETFTGNENNDDP
jgi:hypothetical protein